MEHLPNLVTHQRLDYKAKCVGAKWVAMTKNCEWAIRNGGGLVTEQLRLSVMRQVDTLSQLSHCAACSNNQHYLKLQTYFCTSVNTILIEMPDHKVIIIAVTDGYTSFLSVPVWISLTYPFVVRSGWRGLSEDRGIWSSFSTVPDLNNLLVRTDRRLLAVIVGCRQVWIMWQRLINISAFTYIHGGTRWCIRTRICAAGSILDGVIWFFIAIILLVALWPWGRLRLWQKSVPGVFPGCKCGRSV